MVNNKMYSPIILKNIFFRYAEKVSTGDDILVQGKFDFAPAKVIDVTSQVMQGDYNFITFCCVFLVFL